MATGYMIWWREGKKFVSDLCVSSADGDAAMARFLKKSPDSGHKLTASTEQTKKATLDKITVQF